MDSNNNKIVDHHIVSNGNRMNTVLYSKLGIMKRLEKIPNPITEFLSGRYRSAISCAENAADLFTEHSYREGITEEERFHLLIKAMDNYDIACRASEQLRSPQHDPLTYTIQLSELELRCIGIIMDKAEKAGNTEDYKNLQDLWTKQFDNIVPVIGRGKLLSLYMKYDLQNSLL